MVPKSGTSILIVDDERELLEGIASYFRRKGQTVITASTFNDGLRALENDEHRINVLISDARMPGGNGIGLITRHIELKGDPRMCVLITGALEPDELPPSLDDIKIFVKPFSVSALYREVQAETAGETGDADSARRTADEWHHHLNSAD